MNESQVKNIGFFTAVAAEALLVYILGVLRGTMEPILPWSTHITVNASFNFLSACCLTLSYYLIRKRKIKEHIVAIHMALFFSFLFLISYILFHLTHNHPIKEYIIPHMAFYTLLGVHILASVISLPCIFITYGLALINKTAEHKTYARNTFFLWEFVSVTGIMVVIISLLSQ